MFKFIHAADIHLDSPFLGLERYEGAPVEQMRQATHRALANLVQLALDEQVAFVLIAGDLYDGNWRDYRTGLFFVNQVTRLRQGNIPVFAIAGNHDAANKMTRTLRMQADVMLKTDEPETRFIKDLDVVIHGQGFACEKVTDDLSARYPAAEPKCFNIGLLHTCADGREGHAKYAPCSIEGLRSKGYDYWALGHVHNAEVWATEPYVVFPGNVQGRHIGETGPKGCSLVTVDDNHRVTAFEFRCLDVLRWARCAVDATDTQDPDGVLDLIANRVAQLRKESNGRVFAVRIVVSGSSPAHDLLQANPQKWINEIRSLAIEAGADDLWIEKVKFDTQPAQSPALIPADGPLGELFGIIEELSRDPDRLQQFQEELADIRRKLPPELHEMPDALSFSNRAALQRILPQVHALLVNRLQSGRVFR